MKLFDLLGGRALRLAVGGLGFWQYAIPLIASGLGALFSRKKSSSGGGSGSGSSNMDAMNQILAQKQAQYAQQQPLRDMLMRQYAGMLPTYMKQDPGYAQWLQGSAPGAQQAMNTYAQSRNPFSSM